MYCQLRLNANWGSTIEGLLNFPSFLSAPGRLLSSPWPGRIEILSVKKLSKSEYEVMGNVIEITSVEALSGGVAAEKPITLIARDFDGHWLIDGVTLQGYTGK